MFKPVNREAVAHIIKMHGPLQPLEVKRYLGEGETTLIGAVLSELAFHKRVAISHVKKGSSPFYYDPTNPASLEKIASSLGEKDRRTFDLLKQERVLDTTKVDPLTRVSLANIKDFSRAFTIKVNDAERLCYRYFLVSEDDAYKILRERFQKKTMSAPTPKSQPVEKEVTSKTEASKVSSSSIPASETPFRQSSSKERVSSNHTLAESKDSKKVEVRESSSVTSQESNNSDKKPADPKLAKKSVPPQKKAQKKVVDGQKTLSDPLSTLAEDREEDEFLDLIAAYCEDNEMEITTYSIVRKGQELDLELLVPTPLGDVAFYAKARSKKKSNDGDVAAALLEAQRRRLPAVYLTSGDVTKKAKELTDSLLKGILIKEIE